MNARINLLLLLALLGSALLLVRTSYEGRRLFNALDRAKSEQQRLDTDYKRLDAERQSQATHLRVEQVAREKLLMRAATPAVTQYVSDDAPGQAASAADSASAAPAATETSTPTASGAQR